MSTYNYVDEDKKIEYSVEKYLIPSLLGNVCDGTDKLMELYDSIMEKMDEGEYLKCMNILRDIRRHIVSKEINTYPTYPLDGNGLIVFDNRIVEESVKQSKYFRNVNDDNSEHSLYVMVCIELVFGLYNEYNEYTTDRLHIKYKINIGKTKRKIIGGWNELACILIESVKRSLQEECENNAREKIVEALETSSNCSSHLNRYNRNHEGLWEKTKDSILKKESYVELSAYLKISNRDMPIECFSLKRNEKKTKKVLSSTSVYSVYHPIHKRENYLNTVLYLSENGLYKVSMNIKLDIVSIKCV